GNYEVPALREPDIATIYQGHDLPQTRTLLEEYGIHYVYLGPLERERYHPSPAALSKLDRLMTRVYENDLVIIYGYGY
ncbi:MAG TPA: hypothetical protein GX702_00340, partial [Chloroflexi bacterium]|nr:hypothetical protein [Chloroflexota bacterium]